MNTKKQASFRQCFVLTEQELRKLYLALTEFSGNTSIEIKSADGLTRGVSTLDELLAFENPPNKDIQELVLSGKGRSSDRSASLRFMNSDDSNTWITMEGPEEAVVTFNASVEEQLSSMKPWYAVFAKLEFLVIGLLLVVVAYLGLLVLAATGLIGGQKPSAPDLRSTALGNLIAVLLVSAPLVVGLALNRWRRNLFPIGVFAIGQGRKRHADREWLRSTVVVSFAVSLAAGVALLLVSP